MCILYVYYTELLYYYIIVIIIHSSCSLPLSSVAMMTSIGVPNTLTLYLSNTPALYNSIPTFNAV